MKKLAIIAVVMAGIGVSSTAQAAIEPATERDLERVCKALKTNSKLQLKRALTRTRIGYRAIAKGLVCNGQDALTFAMAHGATDTATMVAKRANLDPNQMFAKIKQ